MPPMQNAMKTLREAKFLRELDNLVRAIGECKSKAEEDRIMKNEVETLKKRFADPKLDRSRGREYMVGVLSSQPAVRSRMFVSLPKLSCLLPK